MALLTELSLFGTSASPLMPPRMSIRVTADSSAASANTVAGVVFDSPAGSDITGSKIGEFTGQAFNASLEDGLAVLYIPVSTIPSHTFSYLDTPVVLVRNATYTTGIVQAQLIEE